MQEKLGEREGCSAQVVVACFLVQEGANLHARNHMGVTPLQGECPPEAAAIVAEFASSNARYKPLRILHVLSPQLCVYTQPAHVSTLYAMVLGMFKPSLVFCRGIVESLGTRLVQTSIRSTCKYAMVLGMFHPTCYIEAFYVVKL